MVMVLGVCRWGSKEQGGWGGGGVVRERRKERSLLTFGDLPPKRLLTNQYLRQGCRRLGNCQKAKVPPASPLAAD
jgi:hypothetical protein